MSPTAQAPTTSRSEFYWDTMVLEVEGTLFKVPKQRFLDASPIFEDMFRLPRGPSPDVVVQGDSDQSPIRLEGYTAADFEALMMVMHPKMQDLQAGAILLTQDQWIGVLKLSTTWNMKDVRAHAIDRLSKLTSAPLTPVQKIHLSRDYHVAQWLTEGLRDLILDVETTPSDLTSISPDLFRKVFDIQKLAASDLDQRFPLTGNVVQFHPEEFRCPKCGGGLFTDGIQCSNSETHTWPPGGLVPVQRDSQANLAKLGGRYIIGVGNLLCPVYARVGIEADPVTEVVLDPKRWKLGQIVQEVMKDLLEEWDP